jgi:predicted nucleic acid-binding protein
MIVLDASAAVELLGNTQAGKRIAVRLSNERVLHAPHVLDLEVASAFRRQVALAAVNAE